MINHVQYKAVSGMYVQLAGINDPGNSFCHGPQYCLVIGSLCLAEALAGYRPARTGPAL